MTKRLRVLVVDDSAFVRKVLREILTASPDIEVVGIARDGLEALEKVRELAPDLMTLDLVMPNLDGLGVLDVLAQSGGPRVLIVSNSAAESELALAALERGAIDIVNKPTPLATDRLYELRQELLAKVRAVASVERAPARASEVSPVPAVRSAVCTRSLVVIGASTGGPHAIAYFLAALPRDFPLPIAVALHMPAGYTDALARRLDATCAIEVLEAREGLALAPGRAVIACGGSHLTLLRDRQGALHAKVGGGRTDTLHFPSVDVLFESAVACAGAGVIALVLTGMGSDGTRGATKIRKAGGLVLTESESSCVVYGMPRAVVEAGQSDGNAPLQQLPALLLQRV